jgi:hypothetical protein
MDGKTGVYAAPLSKSSGAVQPEIWSGPEASFRILQLLNRGVDEGEFPQNSHMPEAKYGAFPSSKRQV